MSTNPAKQSESKQVVHQVYRGIVKQITSGDCIVIRNAMQKDGKFLEKQVMLSHINAPRLGRRLGNSADAVIEQDQPYAFEAREFLRNKLIGKEVCFVQEAKTNSNIDIGTLYEGRDTNGVNINEGLIEAGLVEVRRFKANDEENRLVTLEEHAKSQEKGRWSKTTPETDHVRDVKWSVENPTNFVDSFRGKPVNAIIEYVKDGSTVRALLLPSYHMVTVQLAGIKAPGFKRVEDKEVAEQFAEEAKFFVESRVLQRDVKIILEGVANQNNGILLGTILHPNGNVSEFLLRDGLARCIDWSMGVVSQGPEKYRLAEKFAKQSKLRLWKSYETNNNILDESSRSFVGKVVEILNGDGLILKVDGSYKKIFLSSVRPPRASDLKDTPNAARLDKKNIPLYDVPYLFEAREFLRKKLMGKRVNCYIDYIQPKSDDYQEKILCTVTFGETNVAEALISSGLARAIRYKQDDDQRSSKYDELLAAESRAVKKTVGLHSTKEYIFLKIADASSDANKAKQFLPSLQRLGRIDALVEFVASASRFRLYLAKESCFLTFLLTGIDCPRLGRPAIGSGAEQKPATSADEFGEEAFQFIKDKVMQHDVKIEIETVDRGGNFLGWMITEDGTNLAVSLVEQGFAAVYKTAERSSYYNLLVKAEQAAKDKKLNRWKNYVEEVKVEEEVEKNEPQERAVSLLRIVVTEISNDLHFYGQSVENGPKLEQLTTQLRSELEQRPPVPGAYTPKVGDLCVAKFTVDNEWYRAKVLKISGPKITVLYVDYGNQETTVVTKLGQIPAGFDKLPAQAVEYALALVVLPKDEDYAESTFEQFRSLVLNDSEFLLNREYKTGGIDFVTLYTLDQEDIGKSLIADGYALCEKKRERRLQNLLTEYMKAQETAKQSRYNLWRYGDITEDDAKEFGIAKPVK